MSSILKGDFESLSMKKSLVLFRKAFSFVHKRSGFSCSCLFSSISSLSKTRRTVAIDTPERIVPTCTCNNKKESSNTKGVERAVGAALLRKCGQGIKHYTTLKSTPHPLGKNGSIDFMETFFLELTWFSKFNHFVA